MLKAIKRLFNDERSRLVEHLWRVTFADGRLDLYEQLARVGRAFGIDGQRRDARILATRR